MKNRALICALVAPFSIGLMACGGQSQDPAGAHIIGEDAGITLIGTLGSTAFLPLSQFAIDNALITAGEPTGQAIALVLTSVPAFTCGTAIQASQENWEYGNTQQLIFGVGNENGNVTPGTYSFPQATGQFTTTDSACKATDVFATSASITLTEVASTALVGTYSLTFGSEGSVSGSFNIPVCGAPTGGNPGPDASTCIQVQ
jgi:hypothetical protein